MKPRGFIFLEALVSLFVFSVSMLGLIGMYATLQNHAVATQSRVQAGALAEQLLGEVESVSGIHPNITALKNQFEHPDGTRYLVWKEKVVEKLPGVNANTQPPEVRLTEENNTLRIEITLFWKSLNDPPGYFRHYKIGKII